MAEAIGLVAAIIQISGFTKEVIDRFRELHSSAEGVPSVYRSVGVDLPVVLVAIKRVQEQLGNNLLGEGESCVLKDSLEACYDDIRELKRLSTRITQRTGTSFSNKSLLVIRSVRYEKEVLKTKASLDSHVQKLIFYQMSSFSVTPQSINSMNNMIQLFARVRLPEPSTEKPNEEQQLQSIQSMKPDRVQSTPGTTIATMSMPRWCLCKRARSIRLVTTAFGRTSLVFEIVNAHRQSCPYCDSDKAETRITIGFSQASRLLGTIMDMMFVLRCGSGGVSISPTLAVRGLCRPDSPIFTLLETAKNLTSVCQTDFLLDQIKHTIVAGGASPYDLDEQGRTVFGVSGIS